MKYPSEEQFQAFAQAVRTRESGDQPGPQDNAESYAAQNSLGFLGAYQFGRARLTDYGICERIPGTPRKSYSNGNFRWKSPWTTERFLSSQATQDTIFIWHVRSLLRWIDSRALEGYVGEQVSALLEGDLDPADDCVVSLSGMVAVCHLVGPGNLLRLLQDGHDHRDGNRTPASHYMKLMGGIF